MRCAEQNQSLVPDLTSIANIQLNTQVLLRIRRDLMAALGGCGVMPVSGPAATDILAGQRDPVSLNYAVVKLTPKVIGVLSKNLPRLITFGDNRLPRDITFGVGDILSVTIFEASSGGLFIPAEGGVRPGNFVSIPNQAVDIHGNISIPYAGSIQARGRTQVQVQDAIVAALKNRAIEPQVIVSVVEQKTSMITILGEGRSARIPATASPERLLDVISRAGMVTIAGTSTGPPELKPGCFWSETAGARSPPLARSFMSRSTMSTCIPTIRSTCIGNRRPS